MKVAIIGLSPTQATTVKNEFSDSFSLTFVSSSESRIPSTVDNADNVVVMTKFVSHRAQNLVRNHPGLLFHNGGVSGLKDLLHTLEG